MKSISLKSSSFEHTCAHTIYRNILLANHVLLCMTMPNEIFEYFEELHSAVVAVKDQRDINMWYEKFESLHIMVILRMLDLHFCFWSIYPIDQANMQSLQWCLGMRIISNLTVMHQIIIIFLLKLIKSFHISSIISIRTAESLAIFKKHLKTHLFRQHLTN